MRMAGFPRGCVQSAVSVMYGSASFTGMETIMCVGRYSSDQSHAQWVLVSPLDPAGETAGSWRMFKRRQRF
jgi:hypothetical protein